MGTVNPLLIRLLCVLVVGVALAGSPEASEDAGADELMNGFEEIEGASPTETNNELDDSLDYFEESFAAADGSGIQASASPYDIDGYAKLGTAFNFAHPAPPAGETDWREFSKLKAELYLEFNARIHASWRARISGKGSHDFIYSLRERDAFTDDVIDAYENELALAETYIEGSLFSCLDLKMGRQIVVWGKSDNIRITDVLNPLDLREPGLTDIEDLRLPVTMTRLDFYRGDWHLGAILIHEIRYNQNPQFGSDFYPQRIPPPDEEDPEEGFYETETALSLGGIFSGWDIAFYYANILNDAYHPERVASTYPILETRMKHARLDFYGMAFNVALGNWLFKAEGAYLEGLQFFNTDDETFSRMDVLAGLEYSGISDTTLSLELANRHILDFDERLEEYPDDAIEDDVQTAFRLTRTFLNETLACTFLAMAYGASGEGGGLNGSP